MSYDKCQLVISPFLFIVDFCLPGLYPADTRRNDNVFTTSTRRRRRRVDVVKTLSLRHYCVMCPLGRFALVKSISICGNLIGMWLSLFESSTTISLIFFTSDFLNCAMIFGDSFIVWLRYYTLLLSSSLPNVLVMSLDIKPSSLISDVPLKRCFLFLLFVSWL